ncbi:hypothetical protein LNQ03_08215 [Klebsiella pneumoniae subsp. pneumoniae]|nr:hypothetical protein [Klebsiella pneumoniae subsp. pneumoniae]
MAATAPVPARSATGKFVTRTSHAPPGRLPLARCAAAAGAVWAGRAIVGGLARSALPQMDAPATALGWRWRLCALGAAVLHCWLACGPARGDGWALATAGPAGPAAGRRPVPAGAVCPLDGDWWTVLWGHLPWVVPGCCLFCAWPGASAIRG